MRLLLIRTLAEDFRTFHVSEPARLATLTIDALRDAGPAYPDAARRLALEVYPTWQGQSVRDLYHDYNWHVERAGSAALAEPWLWGTTHVDIGGGPGTFALEVIRRKMPNPWAVTIADLQDYRNPDAKAHPHIGFAALEPASPLPFADGAFDSGSLLYVLHHIEQDHADFLRAWARCIRHTLILFEDVKIDPHHEAPTGVYRPVRALEADFVALSLEAQHLYMAGIDYVCNHIASQVLSMPVPGKYYGFEELSRFLKDVFPTATVMARYHGMYDTKCYPNPEALYVVEFA